MIKNIARDKCNSCSLKTTAGCPVVDSCHTDAIRLDENGFPYVAYGDDCDTCFLCYQDCPNEAVDVSARIPVPFLTVY
jgi:NAD-dependent dihydropyrimidine dehydrogenase PreA subunit